MRIRKLKNSDFEYEISDESVRIKRYIGKSSVLIIPEMIDGLPVTELDGCMFVNMETGCYDNNTMTSIYIPEGVDIEDLAMFIGCRKLQDITVSPDNPKLLSENGVLYDKNKRCLTQYPIDKQDKAFIIPDGVESICPESFRIYDNIVSNLIEIFIPPSVCEFNLCWFTDLSSECAEEFSKAWIVRGEYHNCIPNTVSLKNGVVEPEDCISKRGSYNVFKGRENLIIVCDEGSPAHQYAINQGLAFRVL